MSTSDVTAAPDDPVADALATALVDALFEAGAAEGDDPTAFRWLEAAWALQRAYRLHTGGRVLSRAEFAADLTGADVDMFDAPAPAPAPRRARVTTPLERRPRRLTAEQHAEIARLTRAGLTAREVGQKIGFSHVSILRSLKRAKKAE